MFTEAHMQELIRMSLEAMDEWDEDQAREDIAPDGGEPFDFFSLGLADILERVGRQVWGQ